MAHAAARQVIVFRQCVMKSGCATDRLLVVNADGKEFGGGSGSSGERPQRVELSPSISILINVGGFCGNSSIRNALTTTLPSAEGGHHRRRPLESEFAAFGAYGDVQRANPGGDGRIERANPLRKTIEILGVRLDRDNFWRRQDFCGSLSACLPVGGRQSTKTSWSSIRYRLSGNTVFRRPAVREHSDRRAHASHVVQIFLREASSAHRDAALRTSAACSYSLWGRSWQKSVTVGRRTSSARMRWSRRGYIPCFRAAFGCRGNSGQRPNGDQEQSRASILRGRIFGDKTGTPSTCDPHLDGLLSQRPAAPRRCLRRHCRTLRPRFPAPKRTKRCRIRQQVVKGRISHARAHC